MSLDYASTSSVVMNLNSGSAISVEDRKFFVSQSVFNHPFGSSASDTYEVGVYDPAGTLISWKRNLNNKNFTPISRSYFDLDKTLINYNFNLLQSEAVILNGEYQVLHTASTELAVSIADDLNSLGLNPGSYTTTYTLMRDTVGNENEKLIISEISPSRTELRVFPTSKRSQDTLINDQFDSILNNKVFVNEVHTEILALSKAAKIDEIYFATLEGNEVAVDSLMFFYSLKADIDVINFLFDLNSTNPEVTETILYQFENRLFASYDDTVTFGDLKERYRSDAIRIIKTELNKITTFIPKNFDDIVNYILSVFDQIYLRAIEIVEVLHERRNNKYLKLMMNFSNNDMVPVLTHTSSNQNITETEKHIPLFLKLRNPLSEKYQVDTEFYLSRVEVEPIIQSVIFFRNVVIQTNIIKGPNFNIREEQNLNETKIFSEDELIVDDELSSSLHKTNTLDKNLSVDYRFFENFVKFSSADARVKNHQTKLDNIDTLEDEIEKVDASLASNPTDIYFLSEKSDFNNQINEIKNSFDGYEDFLFNNPEFLIDHTRQIGDVGRSGIAYTSASLYDRLNQDSLFNNIPDYLSENKENADYINFVDMIGQFFDQIWIYVESFPSTTPPENREDIGVPSDII